MGINYKNNNLSDMINYMATLSRERIDLIEAKTSDLLQQTSKGGNIELPVNLGKVANSLNVKLMSATFSDPNAIGLLKKKEGTIYIANETPPTRAAFTIAHELGHFILHERESDTYWRLDSFNLDKQSDQEETEANWFAASLLMPKSEVIKWWKLTRSTEKMAKIFGVSKIAMVYRLQHLGLR